LNFAKGEYGTAKKFFAAYAEKTDNFTADQLWLAVRIERRVGDRNSEQSYSMQLRKRFPDSNEARLINTN
jgi:type IV pilus assembly protein PilF